MTMAPAAAELLERMPQELYRRLSSPATTARLCTEAIESAQRLGNPRIIQSWVDYERTAGSRDVIEQLLAIALELSGAERADFPDLEIDEEPTHGVWAVEEGLLLGLAVFDERLAQHSRDVASLSVRLARRLDVSAEWREQAERLALIHEIARPRMTVRFPMTGSVDADALIAMRETLATLPADLPPALRDLAPLLWELYVGELFQCAPVAVIVRAADAFISLCEPRTYRRQRLPDEALGTMRTQLGSRFSDDVYRALIEEVAPAKLVRTA